MSEVEETGCVKHFSATVALPTGSAEKGLGVGGRELH